MTWSITSALFDVGQLAAAEDDRDDYFVFVGQELAGPGSA